MHHAIQIFTDASKEGWGAHLGNFTTRGTWSVPESHLHINFLELKAVLLALKRSQHLVQGKVVLVATDNTTVVAYINKEGGMRSGTPVLVQSETGSSEGQAHPWSSECDCRQVVSSGTGDSHRVVPSSGGLQPSGSNLAPATSGHVCNKVQSQATPIRVPSTGSQCLGSGCSDIFLGKPGHVCISSSVVTRKSGQQTIRSPLQESDHNSPGLAQHAMVLGSSGTIIPDLTVPTQPSGPSDSAIQQGSSQQPDQPKPSRLAPRAETIKEQGFSSPVASQIEAPQRSSTRTVYEAKWSVFV